MRILVLVACTLSLVAAVGASQTPASLDDYILTLPPNWPRTVYPDGIVYASPAYETGERCQLTTFQMRGASGDLLADARRAFADIFREDPFQNNGYPYPTATISRGTAATAVTRISPTELLQTTNAYFGDGSYRIAGNRIELAMDRDRTHPQRGFIRLEQDSQDGMSWKDRLCLLLEGIGEVCYGRE